MRRYNIDNLMRKPSNNTLRTVSLENPRDLCFMVNDTDVALLSLLNRAIRVMGSEKITSSVNKYTYYGQPMTFRDFVLEHLTQSLIIVFIFLLLIFGFMFFYIRSIAIQNCLKDPNCQMR